MYSFDYEYENPDDDTDTQIVTHTVNAEANLIEVLTAFKYFLQASGFTYVTQLSAQKDNGEFVDTAICVA